jgi:hypothetical protein
MMAAEGPFLAAVIARLGEPKFNLAAFGVAFSFAMILQSPVIMIMTAATALARDRVSFRRLRLFAYGLSGAVTALMLVVALPPVFDWIAHRLIGLPEPVALLCHPALVLLLPWPAAIGYRRLYQGVLIRSKRRGRARITWHFGIPSSGHLRPILNRKILEIVLLLLRFCSIGSTKSDPNLGANSANLFLRGP